MPGTAPVAVAPVSGDLVRQLAGNGPGSRTPVPDPGGPAAPAGGSGTGPGQGRGYPAELFVLGFFCNIFVYIAVEGYKTFPLALGKYLAIFVGITVFIMSAMKHSVADMFYYSWRAGWTGGLVRLLVITAGNVWRRMGAWGARQGGETGCPVKSGDRGGFPGAFFAILEVYFTEGALG